MSSSIPLTQAVTSGDEGAVNVLLARGADVNETTSGGQTALTLAVICGHTNLVKILVNAGADPHLRDNLGLNAIDWAQRRGLKEALEILESSSQTNTASQTTPVLNEEPLVDEPPSAPDIPDKKTVSPDDKSSKWLAGVKQRLDEQELRRMNRNEPPPEPPTPEAVANTAQPIGRVITLPPSVPSPPPNRKRCPKCNAVYNGDLLSYCVHHIVPLVDADAPIIDEPPKRNIPLFWIVVVITLAGSLVVGSLLTGYLYRSDTAVTPTPVAPPVNTQKGSPELGGELVGKAASLPAAECPLGAHGPVSGTVTVRVKVDKKGQVSWARGSGGDWLMRGASTEAAMKSTFAPEKLRGRETEGTITYTFKP